MISKGFTLIELMIVVAIIGILSMFAMPAFQDYTRKTHVAEGFSLVKNVQLAAGVYMANENVNPPDNASADLADPIEGNAVDDIQVTTDTIIITYNSKVTGSGTGTITMTYRTNADAAVSGSSAWECTATTLPHKLLPRTCRDQLAGVTP